MLLITEATGYIGRHLVARLIARGERPRCLVRNVKQASRGLPVDSLELVQGDTTQGETLKAAMQGIDAIVHAAFMTADLKQSKKNHYQATNIDGTANLIKAAKSAGVARVIEISGLGTKQDKPGS